MHGAIECQSPDDEDDPFVLIGSELDKPELPGPIRKDRLEDLQVWSALQALSYTGLALNPVEVRIGEDPPDRYLVHGTRSWATELTQLTAEDVRAELAPLRHFGRQLQQRLRNRADDFAHLRGRVVTLTKLPGASLPRNPEQLLSEFESILQEDKGFLGLEAGEKEDGFDWGLKPGSPGLYDDHGPFSLIVHLNPGNNEITVSASTPGQIHRSEAVAALAKCIADKDKEPRNEVLIITCGRVDDKGYTCPLDFFIFELLFRAFHAGVSIFPETTNIRGILINRWNSPFLLSMRKKGSDLPWRRVIPFSAHR